MTVKELKEYLQGVPDTAVVMISYECWTEGVMTIVANKIDTSSNHTILIIGE